MKDRFYQTILKIVSKGVHRKATKITRSKRFMSYERSFQQKISLKFVSMGVQARDIKEKDK